MDKKAFGQRVAERREQLEMSQEDLAKKVGMRQQGIASIESGKVSRPRLLPEMAEALKADLDWLLYRDGPDPEPVRSPKGADFASQKLPKNPHKSLDTSFSEYPAPNAQPAHALNAGPVIDLYGQASAGKDGEFPWSGEVIGEVMAPPSLSGVRGAYAVQVAGDSMVPKFRSGDTVYVNPHRPVRRDDYVVVQIHGDEGSPPLGYVKRFVSLDLRTLRLEQLNPKKTLTFPAKRVSKIEKIVGSDEA